MPKVEIVSSRDTQYGTFYELNFNDGVIIKDCQRKKGTGAKGDYDFISLPQKKGKDDKWWAIIKLTDELSAEALKVVREAEGETPSVDEFWGEAK